MKQSNFTPMTLAEITLEAESLNCDVIVAKENELQFDLDTVEAQQCFEHFFARKIITRWPQAVRVEWASRGNNCHVVVSLPEPLDATQRIAIQAMGGSDFGREFSALMCHNAGSENPILLFKPRPKMLAEESK